MNAPPIDYAVHAPQAFQHLLNLSMGLHKGPLGHKLVELVSLRISQINGCVYCLDMHATALRKAGMDQRKLDTLAAWRESPLFDDRERAALGWAEALNAIGTTPVPDGALDALRPHFDEREISELSFTAAMINAWNMLNVGLHRPLPIAA
ncbi:carboxymuconolactone decarboxylase family protein [Lysobacter solisilvae (ex Woo and Kim 2020)]|uniref:Carboxymuconolactone decarboxylase family protein n=1 Tax=Agrilutibacter terrestris TaxID=2865112 RepID=A0A7H0FY51_9GAMM|nr:carboxymuconolactone decarboxylase family protein [Lysobacter terrestris]QNP40967.1 carboxymuconolactone decarboxylase family protein [Lysobacter terrestris]